MLLQEIKDSNKIEPEGAAGGEVDFLSSYSLPQLDEEVEDKQTQEVKEKLAPVASAWTEIAESNTDDDATNHVVPFERDRA